MSIARTEHAECTGILVCNLLKAAGLLCTSALNTGPCNSNALQMKGLLSLCHTTRGYTGSVAKSDLAL